MATSGYRLGIDFGTSSTVAALSGPNGRTRPLLFDSSPLLASAVFAGPGADVLTGADAERAALAYPAGLEANPKRRVDDGTVWLGEREYPVVDLVAAVLQRVAHESHRIAGEPPAAVVLTHPAEWGRARLGVLGKAAARAGLGQVGFVAEPVAAAAYFATVLDRRIPPGRCLVVYDLGAGTFDVSVVRPSPAGFQVVAAAGLDDVGGVDLDATVVDHARMLTANAVGAWQRLDWPQTSADQQARHTLWRGARAAKEQLSRHPTSDLHVPLVGTEVHLTREEFEKAARPHLDRTAALTLSVLREAGVPQEQLGEVFLVGGSSRIPLAATLLHRTLRLAPTAIDQPELVVAEGSLHTRPATGQQPPEAVHTSAVVPTAAPPTPAPPDAAIRAGTNIGVAAAQAPDDAPPTRSRQRWRWVVVAAAVTAALVPVALLVDSVRGGSYYNSASNNASPKTSVAVSASAGGGVGAPVSGAPSATASPEVRGSVGNDEIVLPDGFHYYTDATYGWKIAVPNGWVTRRDPGYPSMVYFDEPTTPRRQLGVDRSSTPKPDLVADWTDLERRRVAGHELPGYERVRIEAVPYFRAAADWVYTYDGTSGRLQVHNRGFVVNDHLTHAIFWLTPQAQWAENESNWQLITASFRPGR